MVTPASWLVGSTLNASFVAAPAVYLVKVALGPAAAAEFAAASVAVPAAIEIPTVPVPVQAEMVTVRVVVPVPLTAFVQLALPVVLRVTSPLESVTAAAPV
jgi:hypothetical protein